MAAVLLGLCWASPTQWTAASSSSSGWPHQTPLEPEEWAGGACRSPDLDVSTFPGQWATLRPPHPVAGWV